LGLEELSDSVSPVVFDMLAEVSQSIQYSCLLEQKSREVEAAMAQLVATNERLQKTQDQLLQSEARFENCKRGKNCSNVVCLAKSAVPWN
jgi:two-component system NtrC family sensor kinase